MSLQKLKDVYFLGSMIKNIKGIFNKVNEIVDYLNGTSGEGSYKRYVASISVDGSNVVTLDVIIDEIGCTYSLTDLDYHFNIISDNKFTVGKTQVLIEPLDSNTYGGRFLGVIKSINMITLENYDTVGSQTFSDVLVDSILEIKVYN